MKQRQRILPPEQFSLAGWTYQRGLNRSGEQTYQKRIYAPLRTDPTRWGVKSIGASEYNRARRNPAASIPKSLT